MARNIQEEIAELEKSKGIQILGIETMDEVLTRPVVEATLDSLKDTLGKIDLDEIADSINEDMKEFARNA